MAVKIRLQRKGRTKAPFYHIVIADARAPRDGRFIEKIGTYNPLTVPATIEIINDRAFYWLMVGAQPTDTVNAILSFKGILLRKHLQMGVNKGAISQEDADAKLAEWVEQKDAANLTRRDAVIKSKLDTRKKIDGVAKVKVKPVVVEELVEASEEVAEAPVEAVVETAAEVVEAPVAEVVEAPVEAATEVVEAPVEAVAEAVEVVEAPVEAVAEAAAEVVEAPVEAVAEVVAEAPTEEKPAAE